MMVLWLYDMLWHNVIRWYVMVTWHDCIMIPLRCHNNNTVNASSQGDLDLGTLVKSSHKMHILLYNISISYNEYNMLYIMIYIIYAKKLIEVDKTRNLAASREFKFEFLFFIHKKPIHWRPEYFFAMFLAKKVILPNWQTATWLITIRI